MSDQTPSPRRQVGHRPNPVALEPLPDETAGLSEKFLGELQKELQTEANHYSKTGKMATPRKEIVKDDVAISPRDEIVNPPPEEEVKDGEEPKERKYYPKLRRFFEVCGQEEVHPKNNLALATLQQVVKGIDFSVRWDMETPLQKSIRLRVEAQEAAFRERSARGKELLNEQKPEKSQYDQFMDQYKRAQDENRLGAETDQYVINDIDRRAERQEALAQRREEEKKALGEERKAAARAAMEQRKKERAEKVKQLQEDDEEAKDEVMAVQRVRSKFEKEKMGGAPQSPPRTPDEEN